MIDLRDFLYFVNDDTGVWAHSSGRNDFDEVGPAAVELPQRRRCPMGR